MTRKRRSLRNNLTLLSALFCLAAPGCSRHEATTVPTSAGAPGPAASSGFKAALLTTGPVTDGGWNQSAYEGLLAVQKDLGATVDKRENLTNAQFESAFRDFATQNYNVVFAHGDEFADAAARVAQEFPNTVFITTGGTKTARNLAPIQFATEQGTYLQGMEAALVSKTHKGGFVGGQELPPVSRAAEAFGAGARAIDPKFDLKITYIDSWSNTSAATGQTKALLDAGRDVISHNCDAASKGVFDTAGARPNVYTFGVNADENGKAPNVLSSAFLDIPKAFDDVAASVKNHTFQARPLVLGLKEGDVRLIDNPKLAGAIGPSGRQRIEQARQAIIAGTLKVAGP